MATPVVSVAPDTSFKRTVQVLQEHQISAVPVVDPEGRLLGMVSETDLALKEEQAKARGTSAGSITCRWPTTTAGWSA